MTSFDPNHWKCCPEYTPPVHAPGRNPKNKYEGRTNTSVKTVKVAQDFYGILHPHVATGYKMIGASGSKPIFDDLTTNQFFQNQTRKVGEETGHLDKKLCKYKPDATRNRPRSDWQTDVGLQNFDRRNASYIRLEDGALGSQFTPKTTSQSFFTPPPKGDPPGSWHQGICRELSTCIESKWRAGEHQLALDLSTAHILGRYVGAHIATLTCMHFVITHTLFGIQTHSGFLIECT